MKPERIVLLLAWLLLGAGSLVWAAGGERSLGIWLWIAAASVLAVPLAFWLVDRVVRAVRR